MQNYVKILDLRLNNSKEIHNFIKNTSTFIHISQKRRAKTNFDTPNEKIYINLIYFWQGCYSLP